MAIRVIQYKKRPSNWYNFDSNASKRLISCYKSYIINKNFLKCYNTV